MPNDFVRLPIALDLQKRYARKTHEKGEAKSFSIKKSHKKSGALAPRLIKWRLKQDSNL